MAFYASPNVKELEQKQSKARSNHCRTCTCTGQEMFRTYESRTLDTDQNGLNRSQLNNPLFESRIKEVKGENIFENHITWLKSLSPKPKNLVFKYTSSPRILTRSMMKKMKEQQAQMQPEEQKSNVNTPVKKLVDHSKINQNLSTNLYESSTNQKKLKSSDNYTFSGLIRSVRK